MPGRPFLNLFLFLLITSSAEAQFVRIDEVFNKALTKRVYAFNLKNVTVDSILVLHAQELVFPPFINHFEQDSQFVSRKSCNTVFIGKSDNPFLPEKYTAIRAVPPSDSLFIYFEVNAESKCELNKAELYVTFLDKKYYEDYRKLENSVTDAGVRHCKKLKEKYGRVRHLEKVF